jgi:phospho-N-acetylmuramoyl-pentapeptide-transferase
MIIGKYVIRFLQKKQIGEDIRNLGLAGQMEKKGTPTIGRNYYTFQYFDIRAYFNRLNIYLYHSDDIYNCLVGFIGFMDDYIKVFLKRINKDYLPNLNLSDNPYWVGDSFGVGFSSDVVIKEK